VRKAKGRGLVINHDENKMKREIQHIIETTGTDLAYVSDSTLPHQRKVPLDDENEDGFDARLESKTRSERKKREREARERRGQKNRDLRISFSLP
jgi:hypothetical protein